MIPGTPPVKSLRPLPVGAGATVAVPATVANVGPGFDCLGLAVDWREEVRLEVTARGLDFSLSGPGSDLLPRSEDHLIVQTFRAGLARLGRSAPGIRLQSHLSIPLSSGLGSSSAAIVSGLALAWSLAHPGTTLNREWMLRHAVEIEGHADNVGPAIFGQATVSWAAPAGPDAGTGTSGGEEDVCYDLAGLQIHPDVRVATFTTPLAVSTDQARTLLPGAVPFQDAAANTARAALLVHALTAEPRFLAAGTKDYLHQQYREGVYPQSLALVKGLRKRGLAAVVSGAGPTVAVLHTQEEEAALTSAARDLPQAAGFTLSLHQPGAGVAQVEPQLSVSPD